MQSSSLWKSLLLSFYVVRGVHALPAVRDAHNVTARVPPPQGLTIPLQWQGPGWFPSITMQVGSDPDSHVSKTFNMLPDTGSSSFWVVSDSASSTNGLGATTSETFEAMEPSTWDTVYSHALEVEGTVGKDFVTFAGRPPLKMNIGLVQKPPSTFNDIDGYAGIFGFVSGDSTGPNHATAPTPFRQLVDSGTISAITGWKYPTSPGTEGQVTLGWFDPAHSQPGTDVTVQTADEHFHEYWMVAVASLKVGDKDVKTPAPITALLDTGCVGLMTPAFESIGLLKAIGATYSKIEREWTVPCSTNVVVSFEIGGKLFSAQGTDIIGAPLSDNSLDCRPHIGEDQTLNEGLWIIGSTFLHNWHIVLDGTKNPKEITIARASQ